MLEDRRKSRNLSSISNEFFSYNYLIRADKTGGSVYDTLAPTAEVRALLITHRGINTHTPKGLQSVISGCNTSNNNMRGSSYNRQAHLSHPSGTPYSERIPPDSVSFNAAFNSNVYQCTVTSFIHHHEAK